jgi:hypothetical protein
MYIEGLTNLFEEAIKQVIEKKKIPIKPKKYVQE